MVLRHILVIMNNHVCHNNRTFIIRDVRILRKKITEFLDLLNSFTYWFVYSKRLLTRYVGLGLVKDSQIFEKLQKFPKVAKYIKRLRTLENVSK